MFKRSDAFFVPSLPTNCLNQKKKKNLHDVLICIALINSYFLISASYERRMMSQKAEKVTFAERLSFVRKMLQLLKGKRRAAE